MIELLIEEDLTEFADHRVGYLRMALLHVCQVSQSPSDLYQYHGFSTDRAVELHDFGDRESQQRDHFVLHSLCLDLFALLSEAFDSADRVVQHVKHFLIVSDCFARDLSA